MCAGKVRTALWYSLVTVFMEQESTVFLCQYLFAKTHLKRWSPIPENTKTYSIKAWLVKSNYDRGSELLEWLWNASAISLSKVMSIRSSNLLQNNIQDLHFCSGYDSFSGVRIFLVDFLPQTGQSFGFFACYFVYLMNYESYSVGTAVLGHLT